MAPAVAKEFFAFVAKTLPNLLAEVEDPLEALQRLGQKWGETRNADIEDRSEKVRSNRAKVDKRLAERKAKARTETD